MSLVQDIVDCYVNEVSEKGSIRYFTGTKFWEVMESAMGLEFSRSTSNKALKYLIEIDKIKAVGNQYGYCYFDIDNCVEYVARQRIEQRYTDDIPF